LVDLMRLRAIGISWLSLGRVTYGKGFSYECQDCKVVSDCSCHQYEC
jgi:hypothetical protein